MPEPIVAPIARQPEKDGTLMQLYGKFFVWLDGKAYSEANRDLVPKEHLEMFDRVLRHTG